VWRCCFQASIVAINSLFLLNGQLFLCKSAIRDFFISDLNKRRAAMHQYNYITTKEIKCSSNIRTLFQTLVYFCSCVKRSVFILYILKMRYTLYSQNLKRLPILTEFWFQFQSRFTVILCKLTLLNASHIHRVTMRYLPNSSAQKHLLLP
jgi:hypothetical protein